MKEQAHILQPKINSGFDLAGAGLNGFSPVSAAATLLTKNASGLLQAELSALEAQGQGKVISNPRIMTSDQVKATIEREDIVKVPLLGDLPILGHLFRHSAKLQDKKELLVFLTR